jgi:two-component system, LytTR family, sensor kinase
MFRFLSSRYVIVSIHILIWTALIMLPVSINFYSDQNKFTPPPMLLVERRSEYLGMFFLSNLFLIGYFYFNYYVLIPRILFKQNVARYGLVLLCLLAGWIWLITPFIQWIFHFNTSPPFMNQFRFLPFVLMTAISLAIRLIVDRIQEDKRSKESENETLKSELSFLRSQVSPHFLLNVLNTVVSFSRRKPELVEPTLVKMSHIIRYMLYEKEGAKVELTKEIEYLESYIELQKLRFGDSIQVTYNKMMPAYSGPADNMLIEPMLLIPFVENAFKHGSAMIQSPAIDIRLAADRAQLVFIVKNKFNADLNETKDIASGIGLKNVRRRLELLYGPKQSLSIGPSGDWFEIEFKLSFI